MAPVAHAPHEVEAEDSRTIFVQAVLLGPRRLLTGVAFQRAIDDPRTPPSIRWGSGRNDLIRTPPDQEPSMPRPCGQQPAPRPLRKMAGGQPRQPCDGGLLLVNGLAHNQPAADEVMAVAQHGAQHLQPMGDGLGPARAR